MFSQRYERPSPRANTDVLLLDVSLSICRYSRNLKAFLDDPGYVHAAQLRHANVQPASSHISKILSRCPGADRAARVETLTRATVFDRGRGADFRSERRLADSSPPDAKVRKTNPKRLPRREHTLQANAEDGLSRDAQVSLPQ